MKQEVNIIEEHCDYLNDDIQDNYDFSNAEFYNFRDNRTVVEIEPDLYKYFGSDAKIINILKSIKESENLNSHLVKI
jgi:hypothetical protein